MNFNTAKIKNNTLVTHRSSYLLDSITAADVQRPLLSISLVPVIGSCAFCFAFRGILFPDEIAIIIGSATALLIGAARIGQLKLVSRDLRGSELSGAVWGSTKHLKSIHAEITRVWESKEARHESA
ncbi:hypothetical protein [Profundibacter amoris]|uniref:Uncharacterized protein n=1 Tax=Profundibacter amoris TaxID=2171755 RepID=A0A347UG46_9RHOB|nr:hypothetical protein [Profundibacter amoris]AXX97824.1 hypothetical protein BAR1_07710 [Profundibacter amoris]